MGDQTGKSNRKQRPVVKNLENTHDDLYKRRWQGEKPEWPSWRPKPVETDRDRDAMKRRKIDEFENPWKSREPPYPYKRDALRKKAARKALPGQDCDCCRSFWSAQEKSVGREEAQRLKNLVSRHRDRFPRPVTPPGFWNPTFTSSEDSE